MKKIFLILLVLALPLGLMACEDTISYDQVIEILSFPEEVEEDIEVYSKITIDEIVFSIDWETNHPEIFAGKSQPVAYEEIHEKITLFVVLPKAETDVNITATISHNGKSMAKEFSTKVLVSREENVDVLTLEEFRNTADGVEVSFQGVVTNIVVGTDRTDYYIQAKDNSGGILLFNSAEHAAKLLVGNEVKATGPKGVYQGLHQINIATDVIVISIDNQVVVKETTLGADVNNLQGATVKVTGTLVNDLTLTAVGNAKVVGSDEVEFEVRFVGDSYSVASTTIPAGTKITVQGPVGCHTLNQVLVYDASLFSKGEAQSDDEIIAAIKDTYQTHIPKGSENQMTNISLPITAGFGSTIVWTSSNLNVIANDGKVTRPDVDTEVILTYQVQYKGVNVEGATGDVIYIVVAKVDGASTFTEDFSNTGIADSSSYGDYEFVGVDGSVWTLTHVNAWQADKNFGEWVNLRRANEPSTVQVVVTGGIKNFSFEYWKAFTSGTPRTYSVEVIDSEGNSQIFVIEPFGEGSGADLSIHIFESIELNLTGTVTIKIYATGATGNQHMCMDNFTWTSYE